MAMSVRTAEKRETGTVMENRDNEIAQKCVSTKVQYEATEES